MAGKLITELGVVLTNKIFYWAFGSPDGLCSQKEEPLAAVSYWHPTVQRVLYTLLLSSLADEIYFDREPTKFSLLMAETFDDFLRAFQGDQVLMDLPKDFSYLGSSPSEVRAQLIRRLGVEADIDESTTNALVLAFLNSILVPKKAHVGLGLKMNKYGESAQEAAGSFSRQSEATMEDFNQISKNTLLASDPEISLLTLASGSGRPGTALLGLNLVQTLKDSIRKRDESIIGSTALGSAVNKEAAEAAWRGQDQSDIGSAGNPLFGGRRFSGRIEKVKTQDSVQGGATVVHE